MHCEQYGAVLLFPLCLSLIVETSIVYELQASTTYESDISILDKNATTI